MEKGKRPIPPFLSWLAQLATPAHAASAPQPAFPAAQAAVAAPAQLACSRAQPRAFALARAPSRRRSRMHARPASLLSSPHVVRDRVWARARPGPAAAFSAAARRVPSRRRAQRSPSRPPTTAQPRLASMPRRAQQPARALRGSREIVPLGLPSARALGLARPPRSSLAHVRSCTARQRCLHPRTHNSREPPIAPITLFIFP